MDIEEEDTLFSSTHVLYIVRRCLQWTDRRTGAKEPSMKVYRALPRRQAEKLQMPRRGNWASGSTHLAASPPPSETLTLRRRSPRGTAFFTRAPPPGCVRPTPYRRQRIQVTPPAPTTQHDVRARVTNYSMASGRQSPWYRGSNDSGRETEHRNRRESHESATVAFDDESESESGATLADSPKGARELAGRPKSKA
ncbi:hypothetical protein M427DRAFT_33200 [Gonapodya prolifera JEL478]|uniref:Uncharacterized protein n=1 Tax=Gonapodya prolifera (strain JEL478) TaxID=1344416 RepID=A0A139ACT0_GONPJ|nr:hypothetical protein M427DRAFT_33200 [Gonapodya prolifera JEL478]|eukprot:KXS14255.1 hypothetical protein M427DRAFT_33200 [Gonapodya prolifera JEL478]